MRSNDQINVNFALKALTLMKQLCKTIQKRYRHITSVSSHIDQNNLRCNMLAEICLDGGTRSVVSEYSISSDGGLSHQRSKNIQARNESVSKRIGSVLIDTFLPNGYPASVKPDYWDYQCWDSLQGLCSYLRSVLSTKSLLSGLHVSTSTAVTAAIAWVIKDGFGMIGSLLVAYSCSAWFEVYAKEFRLIADALNNVGLLLDLLSSYFPSFYFPITILSSVSKAACGLIAGATKARISAHFANKGHLADVTAKESTQETAVALIGLVLGSSLAYIVGESEVLIWSSFFSLLVLHMYANYRLVKVLVFTSINCQRAWLLAVCNTNASFPSPEQLAAKETLSRPIWLILNGPRLGCSIQSIADAKYVRRMWKGCEAEPSMIYQSHQNNSQVAVLLREDSSDEQILYAYFIACAVQQGGSLESLQQFDKWSEALIQAGWDISDAAALAPGKWRYSIVKDKAR